MIRQVLWDFSYTAYCSQEILFCLYYHTRKCNLTGNSLQLFSAGADVLHRIGEDGRIIQEFIQLGAKAKVAASEAMDAEATLGEIPDEFLDPIQVCFPLFCVHVFLLWWKWGCHS